jgi:RimJ/RimL family protein N-acetyltransferase
MKDPALLEATGSEPLSFEEEVEMQRTWRDDKDKCTFIVLAKEMCHFEDTGDFVSANVSAMVGDVNLFLSEEEEDEEDEVVVVNQDDQQEPSRHQQAEIDIMIAERGYRGKGLGREASLLMMLFGATKLSLRRFFSKINEDNVASRSLFEQKLGFVECNYAACFKQFELERRTDTPEEMVESLKRMVGFDELEIIACPTKEEVETRRANNEPT